MLACPPLRRIQWVELRNPGKTRLSADLEQVHVIGMFSRGLRLGLVAGLGVAVAMPALAVPAENTRSVATQTALNTEIHDQGGRTQAVLAISVTGADGLPASGAVVIEDRGKPLAGLALNAEGRATSTLVLLPGDHDITAVYQGDSTHSTSMSQTHPLAAATGSTPDFSVAVSPATLSLKQGQSGSVSVSVIPINAASLTAPMFVTLSCAGLPDQTACTFTPENVQILPNASGPVVSSMVIATQAQSLAKASPAARGTGNPVAWAILLPGALGLAGLAFGARRRQWLSRFALIALVGFIAMLGTTACSPLYNYRNHGPPTNRPTPTGTFTVTVNGQSSNGVTAITHPTTMSLTVTPQ